MRQAEGGEGGVDRRPVETGEGVVMHAPLAPARAAGAEELDRLAGGELEAAEGRHRHHRHLAPGADRGGSDPAPVGEVAQRGDPFVLEGERRPREVVERFGRPGGDGGEDRVEHLGILPRREAGPAVRVLQSLGGAGSPGSRGFSEQR